MGLHRAKRGLDLPITGAPEQSIAGRKEVTQVATLADDFPGMKPRFFVQEGESVRRGQALFEDRKQPGVIHTAPGAGVVRGIHRGQRRALLSVVIELSEGERSGAPEYQKFDSYTGRSPNELTAEDIKRLLVESGVWTSLRTRPFGHTPSPSSQPDAIFVSAMDTEPLAADPEIFLSEEKAAFDAGLLALSKLTSGPTFLCAAQDSQVARGLEAPVTVEHFTGPHPAGNVGFQIHTLLPVHRNRIVWTTTYQEVVAIGHLMQTGKLSVERVIAICGPAAARPRLVRTRQGASMEELLSGELRDETPVRYISGSVLSGTAATEGPMAYLGRRSHQVSVLEEASQRVLFGWLRPGLEKFSVTRVFLSSLFPKRKFALTTDTNGSSRAMVPIGTYEKVMPFDILPTHLLRALLVGDLELAEKLGALELDEEDVALCSFVCPGKMNYGLILRANLERAFAEG